MLLLLLLVVDKITILLMVLLNAINGESSWLSYRVTLLSLLLINKRPTRFVVMAWNCQRDLASQFFSNAVVEDKTIWWFCHNTGQHKLGFSICCTLHQLLLYRGLRKICSCTNLGPESLCTVCGSGTLQGAQIAVAHWPVTNEVDCCEEFYSFTNQAFVLWRLGTSQEWWRLLAQSTPTRTVWWCADMMFCYCFCNKQPWLPHGATLSTLLLTMTAEKIYDRCICFDGSRRVTSFIAGIMPLYSNDEGPWSTRSILRRALWRLHNRWRLWPSCLLRGAHCCLAWHMWP